MRETRSQRSEVRSQKKAVVLLSGGLDSTTTLYMALNEGYECHCLIVDYGQKHKKEIKHAQDIAAKCKCKHYIVKLSLPWQGSSLTDENIAMPERRLEDISGEIPSTYVPSRNTIFLSIAAALAETLGAEAIFIGANSIDYSGYPDCRPEYLDAFQDVINKGTKAGVEGKPIEIIAPLIDKTKHEIVKIGKRLKVPHELTWSCYKGEELPCGVCDSCVLRKSGFEKAGVEDAGVLKYGNIE
jgi:7-cyano-7-deazaguanine synthase